MLINRYQGIFTGMMLLISTHLYAASFDDKQKQEIGQVVQEYLVSHPEVIIQAIQVLQTKEAKALEEKAKMAISENLDGLFNSDSPTIEGKAPKVTLIEFFDYNCPHCRTMSKMLDQLQEKNKDIRIVYKELPVLGEDSLLASKAALAAREQKKYVEFHQKLMASPGAVTSDSVMQIAKELGLDSAQLAKDMESEKVRNELQANQKQAISLGIRGTPSFVIGRFPATKDMPKEFIPGETSQEELMKRIDAVR